MLCVDCAALKVLYPTTVLVCGQCGELADPITIHRRDMRSYLSLLPDSLAFPFRWPAVLGLILISLGLSLAFLLGAAAGIAMTGLSLGALFGIVPATVAGKDTLDFEEFLDPLTNLGGPLVRFVLATAPVWVTAVLAVRLGMPALWGVVAVLSLLWVPIALIAAAVKMPLLELVNPVRLIGSITLLGVDYFTFVGWLALLSVAVVPTLLIGAALVAAFPLPIVSPVFGLFIALWIPVAAFRAAGLLLFMHGDRVGYGAPRDYFETFHSSVQPTRVMETSSSAVVTESRSFAPIELAAEPDVAPAPSRHAPIDLDEHALPDLEPSAPDSALGGEHLASLDAGDLRSMDDHVLDVFRDAMAHADARAAIEALSHVPELPAALTTTEASWLGRAAVNTGETALALKAFTKAADSGDPSTLVILGRYLAEKLNDSAGARTWMERAANEAPDSDAGRFATRWLTQQR